MVTYQPSQYQQQQTPQPQRPTQYSDYRYLTPEQALQEGLMSQTDYDTLQKENRLAAWKEGVSVPIPDDIKKLGPVAILQYKSLSGLVAIGKITPEQANQQLNDFLMKLPRRRQQTTNEIDWNKIPQSEWKYYPGGTERLATLSEADKLKAIGGKESINKIASDFTSAQSVVPGYMAATYGPTFVDRVMRYAEQLKGKVEKGYEVPAAIMEVKWEDYSLKNPEETKYYSQMHPVERGATSFVQGARKFVGGMITFPISVAEYAGGQIIKVPDYITGKEKISWSPETFKPKPFEIPIFSEAKKRYEEWESKETVGPPGLVSSAFRGYTAQVPGYQMTEEEKEYYRKMYGKYPIESIFATAGEVGGLYAMGKLGAVGKEKIIGGGRRLSTYTFNKAPSLRVPLTKAYSFAQTMRPTNLMRYGYEKATGGRRTSAYEYHTPEVLSGEIQYPLIKGDKSTGLTTSKAAIDYFKSKANIKGEVTVTSATAQRLTTPKLRVRPSALIETEKGALLVSHERGRPSYQFPGGGKKLLESPIKSLKREVGEELGIKVTDANKMFEFPDYSSGNLYKIYKTKIEGIPKRTGEIKAISYYGEENIPLGQSTGKVGLQVESFYGKGRNAFHVEKTMEKLKTGNLASEKTFRPKIDERLGLWPRETIIGQGTTKGAPGLFVTVKGDAGIWPFKFGSKSSSKSIGYGWKLPRRAMLEFNINKEAISEVPKGYTYQQYANYWAREHSADIFISPKTKMAGYGLAEKEYMIEPGRSIKSLPLGLEKETVPIGKTRYESLISWQKYSKEMAKLKGYEEYYIVKGKTIPVRAQKLMPKDYIPTGSKRTTTLGKLQETYSKDLESYLRGEKYVPYYSPEYWGSKASYLSYIGRRKEISPSRETPSRTSFKESYETYPSYSYSKGTSYNSYSSYERPISSSYKYSYERPPPYEYKYKPYYTPYGRYEGKYKQRIPIVAYEKESSKEETKGEGSYNVYAKKDATKNARYINVGSDLPLAQALGIGAKAVDETVSRNFVIRKSSRPASPNPSLSGYWNQLQNKYRPPKKRKAGHYIEKTNYAIDSQGEHEGITVQGWIAKRNKRRGYKPKRYKI